MVSKAGRAFTLADGGTLDAHYNGSAIAGTGVTVTQIGTCVQHVQVETTSDVTVDGFTLHAAGSAGGCAATSTS